MTARRRPVGRVLRQEARTPDARTASPPIVRIAAKANTEALLPTRNDIMLNYAVVFFVIALIAAVFGFGGIAAGAVGIAKILFVLFAVLAVASFLIGLLRNR
jgi:uncharacterized membrane protein YtjA (UPF0391 family)